MNIPQPGEAPSPETMRAFGLSGPARPIPGGQGTPWASGGVVLKPGADPEYQAWLGSALGRIAGEGFRLARAVPTRDGAWTHEGWSATLLVVGKEPDHARNAAWREIIEAGRAFHRATSRLPQPPFLNRADTWWSRADRRAWDDHDLNASPALRPILKRLREGCADLGPAQLVHGDLARNVLLAPRLAPAVIDVSPYWRPPSYAEGVVIADALCWHRAPASLPGELGVCVAAVARALLFRAFTTQERANDGIGLDAFPSEIARYGAAAAAIGL